MVTVPVRRGLVDTSAFIALESGRQVDLARLPTEWSASVITLGELTAGVLAALSLVHPSARGFGYRADAGRAADAAC